MGISLSVKIMMSKCCFKVVCLENSAKWIGIRAVTVSSTGSIFDIGNFLNFLIQLYQFGTFFSVKKCPKRVYIHILISLYTFTDKGFAIVVAFKGEKIW